jgi:hypothetical protein
MSWWQRANLSSIAQRHRVFIAITALCTCVHILLAVWFLYAHWSTVRVINVRRFPACNVKVLPFAKHIPGALTTAQQRGITPAVAGAASKKTTTLASTKKPEPKKSVQKNKAESKKPATQPTPRVRHSLGDGGRLRRAGTKIPGKVIEKKKSVPAKSEQDKKKVVEPKKELIKTPEIIVPEPTPVQPAIVPPVPAAPDVLTTTTAEPGVIYIGRYDAEDLQLHTDIQRAVEEHWHAPAGAAANTECMLRAFINPQGVAENITIDKASGMLVYDVAARTALSKTEFPTTVRGQTIVLRF